MNGSELSTFTAAYNTIYDDESSLNKVSDIWSYDDSVNGGSYIETYTIDSEGGIFGSDSEGCSFEGAIEIIDEDYNMYDLTLTASNCDDKDGTYIGKSFLSSESGEDDTLNTYLVGEDFNKQSGLLRQWLCNRFTLRSFAYLNETRDFFVGITGFIVLTGQ